MNPLLKRTLIVVIVLVALKLLTACKTANVVTADQVPEVLKSCEEDFNSKVSQAEAQGLTSIEVGGSAVKSGKFYYNLMVHLEKQVAFVIVFADSPAVATELTQMGALKNPKQIGKCEFEGQTWYEYASTLGKTKLKEASRGTSL